MGTVIIFWTDFDTLQYTDFSNPSDPSDTSFDPHETDYPVVELEYPGHGASERFILLAPKDKDHYNPIMDLEKTLYTIVERTWDFNMK